MSDDVLTRKCARLLQTRTQDSCGPSGCLIDPLVSDRIRIDEDPVALYELSMDAGWGDGLPLLPPTERRVRGILASTPFHTDDIVGILPPMNREATVELVAVNAAMAGCEPWGMPYVIAALEAMCEPSFNLEGVTTTTSSVFPYLIVNGPSRDRVGIDYRNGCMGGAAGRGSMTIGRGVAVLAQHRRPEGRGDVEERVRPTGPARRVLRRMGGAVAVAVGRGAVGLLARRRRRHRARREGHPRDRRHQQRRPARPALSRREERGVPALEQVPHTHRRERSDGDRGEPGVGATLRARSRTSTTSRPTSGNTRGSRSSCGPNRTARCSKRSTASTRTAACT